MKGRHPKVLLILRVGVVGEGRGGGHAGWGEGEHSGLQFRATEQGHILHYVAHERARKSCRRAGTTGGWRGVGVGGGGGQALRLAIQGEGAKAHF